MMMIFGYLMLQRTKKQRRIKKKAKAFIKIIHFFFFLYFFLSLSLLLFRFCFCLIQEYLNKEVNFLFLNTNNAQYERNTKKQKRRSCKLASKLNDFGGEFGWWMIIQRSYPLRLIILSECVCLYLVLVGFHRFLIFIIKQEIV